MELYISVVLSSMHIHTLMMSRARIVLAFVSSLEGGMAATNCGSYLKKTTKKKTELMVFNNALQLLHFE